MSALILQPALDVLLPQFVTASDIGLEIAYGSAGDIDARMIDGEAFDIAILQRHRLEAHARQGRVLPGHIATLGRSGVAVAVPRGADKPEIGTLDGLRRALLAAGSVVYPDPTMGHACGIHFQKIIEQLAIEREVSAKAKLADGSFAAFAAHDSAELAIMQPMEILAADGYDLVGWLADDLQDAEAFTWATGIGANARQPSEPENLLRFLTTASARRLFEAKGLLPA